MPKAASLFFFEPESQLMDYGDVVVLAPQDVKKLWTALKPKDQPFVERPVSSWSKSKLREVIEGITYGPSIRIPVGCVANFGFFDGRHRTRFLIEQGATHIPIRLRAGMEAVMDDLGLQAHTVHRFDAVARAITTGFRHGFTPDYMAARLSGIVDADTAAHKVATGYRYLARTQIGCVHARNRLLNEYVDSGRTLTSDDKNILTTMKGVVSELGSWLEQWRHAGKNITAKPPLPSVPMGGFQRYPEHVNHYN
jgi:hypothetical protein